MINHFLSRCYVKCKRLIVFVFLFAFSSNYQSFAQDFIDKFYHLSTSDEFSLNSVTSIAQGKNGLMWFGTRKGLISYDGIDLKFHNNKFSDSLPPGYSDISGILIDKNDDIWIASRSGLSVYNPRLDVFKIIPLLNKNKPQNIYALCITELSNGEIWVGYNNGIYIYQPKTKKVKHLVANSKNNISSNFIRYIYQTRNGTVWLATNKGLNKSVLYKNGEYKFKTYSHSKETKSITYNVVNVLLEDEKSNLWVGTQNSLDYLNTKDESFSHFKTGLVNQVIRTLTIDEKKRLWVGTYDGISVIDSFKVVHQLKHDPTSSLSLVDNKIKALFKDWYGSIWIGSFYGGINYWNEKQFNFTGIDEGNGLKLSSKVVSSIVQDNENIIYFGTEGGGISVFDERKNRFTYIKKLADGKNLGTVKTLFLSDPSSLWIGTFNEGLIFYNLKTKSTRTYSHNARDKFSLSSNIILAIEKNDDQSLWVGTLNDGLNLLDVKTGKSIRINLPTLKNGLILGTIRKILKAKSGVVYVGTQQCVLSLKRKSGSAGYNIFEVRLAKPVTDSKVVIQDIYEDEQGRIWVGTQNLGLLQLKNGLLYPTELDRNYSIYSVLQDHNDEIWLSSNAGIIKYKVNRGIERIYNFNDGLPANEFLRASKLYSSIGKIYFGGASGITTFNPDKLIAVKSIPPNVIITNFKLFDKPIHVGDSSKILENAIEYTDHINLDYDQNILTINFSMPNFIKNGKNRYYYRLIGLEKDWNQTSKTTASYTIQQGGNYSFEVKGVNEFGVPTKEITHLNITVANAPWKTWWAYTIYCLIILGAFGVFVYFFRSRLILQHNLQLEKQQSHNQEELNKHKLQYFTNVSHEFRTPLTLISGPLQKILEEYKGSHKLFRQLLVIKKNTDQLSKLINELLDFRKFEDSQMRLSLEESNIVEFLNEIFLSFSLQAKIDEYIYTFETDEDTILAYFDAQKLEKVFYNLLSNAFKNTPKGGEISFQIKKTDTSLNITVKDSGDGMEAEEIYKIFNQFYEIQGHKNYGQFKYSSGIGLAIVKSIVELHKGEINVTSEVGKGSSFFVSLPLGRSHFSDEEISKGSEHEDFTDYQKTYIEDGNDMPDLDNVAEFKDQERQTILIVEDNLDIASFIEEVLSEFYNIISAPNGVIGYQLAIVKHPDLIISDMMMPEMDGLELCSKLKTDIRTSHIPFILLSARTSLVHKYDGLESGADDYLFKPFQVKELLLKCNNIINTHNRLKEKFVNSNIFHPAELPVNSLDESMMNKAFQLVKDNVANKSFGIDEFSNGLGISRSLLFTKIKAWTNQTPNDFIISVRIKQAAIMIELGIYNMAEVGYEVGFNNPSYFSKVFKKHLNLTPKEYSERFRDSSLPNW
ncbi:response regulator [Pedobacter sp. SD-b]|uniref:histidine kinase n=1 Tax=Pedobacter segetis TaxID=2793069 RepID=A0ABS1BLD2_9SPHI|nr:hybrid sensor histidine kinase/response regulator transcription factor [Pedobacter segetis]MBK0383700.1 response regulator [Pedobacter segetis]